MEKFNPVSDEAESNEHEMLSKKAWHSLVEKVVLEVQESGELERQDVSVIFIDIDNLKEVNDKLGHLDGDEAIDTLQQAMTLIKQVFRTKVSEGFDERLPDIISYDTSNDTEELYALSTNTTVPMELARLGGDEFGILCYTDSEGVRTVTNRLREAFANNADPRLRELGVDLSIGSSTLRPGMTSSELLKEADSEMYRNKSSHLVPLSEAQQRVIQRNYEELHKHGIRDRDYPKYVKLYVKHSYRDL
jgi:GGDEF domain-containing protein